MARRIVFFFVLLVAAPAPAQLPIDPPIAGRPPNFSQLTGRFTIAATLQPTEAFVEDPIVLRVVIKGEVAWGENPARKNLRIFPSRFLDSFYLEAVSNRDMATEREWEFFWKLRAKSANISDFPSLALSYYSPQVGFQTARSEPITLTINERPKIVVEAPERQSAPASLLELTAWSASESLWRARATQANGLLVWLALAILLAMGSWRVGGILTNRVATQRLVKESRLTSATVAALRQESADLAAEVTRFLQARFGLAAFEPAVVDVIVALQHHGIQRAVRERWALWYGAVAARRFAPISMDRPSPEQLREEAIALVLSVEART